MWQNHDIVIFIQQLRSDFFDFFFTAASFALDMPMLILVFVILYWCVDKKYGVVFVVSFFVGSILNGLVKIIVRSPRPYDPRIEILYGDSTNNTYAFPSGHSQYASSFATGVSLKVYRSAMRFKWTLYAASVLIALLGGFSRLYLGVHFLEDVIAGLAMGVGLMLLLIWAISKIKNDLWYIAFLVPLYIIMIFQPDHQLYGFIGALTGVVVGSLIETRFIKMQHAKSKRVNILRVACGYPPTLGLFAIRYFLFGGTHVVIDYFMMLAVGAYSLLLAPFLFTRLKFFNEPAFKEANGAALID
jgi:membrane-associated phospholipid phosphatase